ncbi:glutamate--cysteine ligase [Pleosporales sp. CAS-2024a]
MDTLDAGHRQSIGLPSINHIDQPDRIKRDEADYHRRQSTAMATPLHPYSGPPHLHPAAHQSSPASAVPGSLGGLLSPPESRRTSGDEKDPPRPPARQSLPSIHEALGSDQALSYPAPVPPPAAAVSAPQQYRPSSAATSPTDARHRPYPPEAHGSQGPANPFSHPRSPFVGSSAAHVPPPPLPPAHPEPTHAPASSSPRPPYATPQHNPKLPTLHPLKTVQSPPASAPRPNPPYPYPPPSTNYDPPPPPPSAAPMSQYSYPQYSAGYPLSAPSQNTPNSAYPPISSAYSAPPRYPPPSSWRDASDVARMDEKKISRASLVPYGEAVKRHLESFDLEASLNEMADGSGRIAEFSKTYRQRAYENHRIGMTPQSMPRLEEVDEMLKQSDRIKMSLQRMRDVVFSHHQTIIVEPPQDHHYRPVNGYDHDSSSNYGDDNTKGTGGFAGADSKTRKRGVSFAIISDNKKHLCANTRLYSALPRQADATAATEQKLLNGVEVQMVLERCVTPVDYVRCSTKAHDTIQKLTRLPDYAKLTRKMGGKAMASSNLRPKSIDHGSPTS